MLQLQWNIIQELGNVEKKNIGQMLVSWILSCIGKPNVLGIPGKLTLNLILNTRLSQIIGRVWTYYFLLLEILNKMTSMIIAVIFKIFTPGIR